MYLPFHLLNPTAVKGFDPSEYTRPEQVVAGLQRLKAHRVPLIIASPKFRSTGAVPGHLGPFLDYLRQNYRLTRTFPNGDGVWERIDSPGGARLTTTALGAMT